MKHNRIPYLFAAMIFVGVLLLNACGADNSVASSRGGHPERATLSTPLPQGEIAARSVRLTPTPSSPTPAAFSAISAPNTPFGVAFGEGSARLDHFMDYIHDLGLHRTKVSFYWSKLEPQPGQFDFANLDEYLQQLGPEDQALLNIFTNGWCTNEKEERSHKGATLRQCPYGAASCQQTCQDHYRDFITRVAEHVRDNAQGGVKYFQRDTEPASIHHFPADQPEAYVEIQALFYDAVKSVLPDAAVIGVSHNGDLKGGVPSQPAFFDYVLEHGRDDFDLLDLRLYQDIYTIPTRVNWFRERMQHFGYEKPIVSTEQGGPDPRTMRNGNQHLFSLLMKEVAGSCAQAGNFWACFQDWVAAHPDRVDPKLQMFFLIATPEQEALHAEIQCYDITQRNVMMLASGVEATWWWNLQSPGVHPIFGKMRLRTEDLQEALPGYACYQRMVQALGDVERVQRIDLADESLYFFEIQRHGESAPMYVAWHRAPGLDPYDAALAPAVNVSLPMSFASVRITDVFGQEETRAVSDGVLNMALSNTPLFFTDLTPPSSSTSLLLPLAFKSWPPLGPTSTPTPTAAPVPNNRPENIQVGLNFIRFYFDEEDPRFQPDFIFQDFADLGVQAYRQFIKADLYWDVIEPQDNQWDFSKADAVIPNADFEPIVTLFSLQYASPSPPWCDSPAQFQKTVGPEARDYLVRVVERYAPYVRYWEIGNEMDHWRAADPGSKYTARLPKCHPEDGFSPAEQGVFLAQVAAIIRQHDPDAVIIMPGMGGLSDYAIDSWLAGVIAGGGSDWFDVVNYHYYSGWEAYTRRRALLTAFLDEHGLAEKPVWLTETGATSSPTLTLRTDYPNSPQSQAADVFRRLIQAWGAGDQLVIWHTYIGSEDRPDNNWRSYGIRTADAEPKLSYYSYRLLTHELIPFRAITPLSADPRRANVYRVETEAGDVKYVVWGNGVFSVPEGVTRATSVVPDDQGAFSWQPVTAGQELTLSPMPVLLK